MKFKEAVEQTPHLAEAYCLGLQALRPEDKPHIEPEDPRKLAGSVDIDAANKRTDPNGNRWDFAIAYKHTNRNAEVVYFVELHTASDSQVGKVVKKAQWLLNWLHGVGARLNAFEKEILWISSGPTTFSLTAPQKKQMAQVGLKHAGSLLRIPNKKP
jgi:hypothetical protein